MLKSSCDGCKIEITSGEEQYCTMCYRNLEEDVERLRGEIRDLEMDKRLLKETICDIECELRITQRERDRLLEDII